MYFQSQLNLPLPHSHWRFWSIHSKLTDDWKKVEERLGCNNNNQTSLAQDNHEAHGCSTPPLIHKYRIYHHYKHLRSATNAWWASDHALKTTVKEIDELDLETSKQLTRDQPSVISPTDQNQYHRLSEEKIYPIPRSSTGPAPPKATELPLPEQQNLWRYFYKCMMQKMKMFGVKKVSDISIFPFQKHTP